MSPHYQALPRKIYSNWLERAYGTRVAAIVTHGRKTINSLDLKLLDPDQFRTDSDLVQLDPDLFQLGLELIQLDPDLIQLKL